MKKELIVIYLSFFMFLTTGGRMQFPGDHAPIESYAQNDYSEQAQANFEYIGTYLPNRSGVDSNHDDARKWIVDELLDAGYLEQQITLQHVEGDWGKNIILKVDGTDSEHTMIIGTHYDGDGVGDNGSGIALLLSTACGLQGKTLPVTTYYVFFDAEEKGLYGSETFVNQMSEEQAASVLYMINIDAIAFGDYCNIYGGCQDAETKIISQLEAYEYACQKAKELNYNVYGPEELDGYFAEHGSGPALDEKGLFTNPWTPENPAPEKTVDDRLLAYSPTTLPASDHVPFLLREIPYIYFEATNWYSASNYPEIAYIGYTDVGDPNVGDGGIIMNTEYDTLETMKKYYPGRSLEHFRLYSPFLSALILEPYDSYEMSE